MQFNGLALAWLHKATSIVHIEAPQRIMVVVFQFNIAVQLEHHVRQYRIQDKLKQTT